MKLLGTVRQDLEDVVAITSSGKKQTNHHRSLIATLTKGMIPASWVRYKVPTSCSVASWVTDFSSRVKQLTSVSKAVSNSGASQLKCFNVWMGGESSLTPSFSAKAVSIYQLTGSRELIRTLLNVNYDIYCRHMNIFIDPDRILNSQIVHR